LHTTDGGTNWNTQTTGTTMRLFSVYFTDNNTGWVVGENGTILKTVDGGTNWESQPRGTQHSLYAIYFTDQNVGWAVGYMGIILKTTNGGTNWNYQESWTTNNIFSIHFTDISYGWAVGDLGTVLNTTDGGTNWNSQSSGTLKGLRSVYFTDNNTGWAVGFWGTILKTTNGGVTFIEDENNFTQPKDFLLSQNYPNPFNPSTSIQYAISSRQFVSLKVYDVLGNEIVSLVSEEKPAGSYEVKFNGDGLTSGIYFYQLRAGDYVETKKLVLLK